MTTHKLGRAGRKVCKQWVLGAGRRAVPALASALFIASPALAQGQTMPPIGTPLPTPDFHFSDPARDAEYWRLYRETERASAVFREAMDAARRALRFPVPAPGTAGWLQAKAAVERAIVAARPARRADQALINFIERERRRLSPAEADYAFAIYRVYQNSLRGSSDILVDLLAALAGIRTGQWPA